MKFNIMAKTAAFVMSLLSLKEIPVEEGKVSFSDEQESKLKEKLTDDEYAKMVEHMNKEIAQVQKSQAENEELKKVNQQLEDAKTELAEILNETNLSEEEKKDLLSGKTETLSLIHI